MKFKDITESSQKCPHCGGPLVEYSGLMEKKDACYYKVKASAKVWPSAYASGRLVQCRKKGAANYGNKSEGVAEGGAKDRQWSNKDMEKLRVATRDFDDILSADGPDATKQDLIKKRIQTKPMAGPKGVLPEQAVAGSPKQEILFYAKLPDGSRVYARVKDEQQLGNLQQQYRDAEIKTFDYQRPDILSWLEARGINLRKFTPGMVQTMYPGSRGHPGSTGLNEFAPGSGGDNDGSDGFSDDTLRQLAAQWYNGDEDPRVEQTLMAAGWEIGQDEGYDDTPGVFVVQAGDINGRSYISWPAQELEKLAEDAVDDFLAKGGKIETGKTHKPRKAERWQGSSHIGAAGGRGSKGTVSGQAANTNPKSNKPVVSAESLGNIKMNEKYNPEYDDEAGMADNNLETLARAVEGIDDLIQTGDNLPEWCQEKIAVAKSMLVAVWDYMYSEEASDEVDPEIDAMFEAMDQLVHETAHAQQLSVDLVWESFEALDDHMLYETAAWRRKEGKSKKGGLNAKGVASYRRENPGSKLQMAVTTKPSKLKKGSKAAKRRKSFCARMSGVKGPMKKPNGKPTRKALALRKWNC
jgi:hypothetical protein